MKLKVPWKLCPRTDITALTLIFKLGSSLLSHCLNVPEASFLSFKDLDFYKEFYKFKAQNTATQPTCDMSHLPRPADTENLLRQNEFDMWRENERKIHSSRPPRELWLGIQQRRRCVCRKQKLDWEEKPGLRLPCEIPACVVGREACGESLAQR